MSDSRQVIDRADGPRSVRDAETRRWDRVRLAIVVGYVAVIGALPFAGEKSAEWSDVRHLVEVGTVTEVHVDGELPARATGFATVQVRWHHGPLDYVTSVRQVRHDHSADATRTDDVSAVLHTAPSAELVALQPGLQVDRGSDAYPRDPAILGFEVPTMVAVTPIVLFLLGLGVLLAGPSPWRATPWAWFWWLWHPIGVVAFALLSGPFPGIPAPRRSARRLTGGWSLLLVVLVSSASFSVWGFRIDL